MSYGVLCLSIFVQKNFTGPSLFGENRAISTTTAVALMGSDTSKRQREDAPLFENNILSRCLFIGAPQRESDFSRAACSLLSVQGETIYERSYSPHYLLAAKQLLFFENDLEDYRFDQSTDLGPDPDFPWWRARLCLIHQRMLSHASELLFRGAESGFDRTIEAISASQDRGIAPEQLSLRLARLYLEKGLNHQFSIDSTRAQHFFELAKQESGLTGSLGVRTRFQTFKTAQLVLHAKSKNPTPSNSLYKPADVKLESDSILLEKMKLDNYEENEPNLNPIDQAILLALW